VAPAGGEGRWRAQARWVIIPRLPAGWATARKHLSLKDVAAAGEWKQVETLMRHYIQTDTATTLQVLDEPLERQA